MSLKKKLHILHIPSWYPTPAKPGYGIFIKRHIELISKNNLCSVIFITAGKENYTSKSIRKEENFYEEIVEIKKTNGLKIIFKPFLFLRAYLSAVNNCIKHFGNPQLIHHHVFGLKVLFSLIIKSKTQSRMVYSEQWSGFYSEDGRFKGLYQKMLFWLFIKNVAQATAVSKSLIEAIKTHTKFSEFTAIPNLVDVKNFKIKENYFEDGNVKILHISALNDKEKNITGILNAFKNALKVNHRLKLTLVGEHEEKEKFIKYSRLLGIENNTIFKGFLATEQLANEYHKADFFLMFSHFETFSCVLAEAVFVGLPVISANKGGMMDFLNAQNAVLITPGNEQQLTNAILQMAENYKSYSFKNQNRSIEIFIDENRILQEFENVYQLSIK